MIGEGIIATLANGPIVPETRPAPPIGPKWALAHDVFAGLIAAIVVLSYCLSYAALLFPGALKSEQPIGLWCLMMGALVAGVVIGYEPG